MKRRRRKNPSGTTLALIGAGVAAVVGVVVIVAKAASSSSPNSLVGQLVAVMSENAYLDSPTSGEKTPASSEAGPGVAIPIRVKSIDAQNQAHGVIEDATGEMRNGTPMVFAATAVVEPKAA